MSLAEFQDIRSIYTDYLHFCILGTTNINGKMTFTSASKTVKYKGVQDLYTEKNKALVRDIN